MRSHQRPHVRSANAIAKPYRFVELPFSADVEPFVRGLARARPAWQPSQWKWHRGTYFWVLRGGPRGDGPGSELVTGAGHDAATLREHPELRRFLDHAFPVPPVLAWLGLSPRGSTIRAHVDNTPHWDEHHRVHVPLVTNRQARLCVEGRFLHLRPGSAWLVNNSVVHGACNDGPPRLHLVVDLPAHPRVCSWIDRGIPRPGHEHPELRQRLERDPLSDLSPRERANVALVQRMERQ